MSVLIDGDGKRMDHVLIQPTYIHRQTVSTNVWVINHNLGKYPSITCVESTGTRLYGTEQYLSQDTVQVTFIGNCTGEAYLN